MSFLLSGKRSARYQAAPYYDRSTLRWDLGRSSGTRKQYVSGKKTGTRQTHPCSIVRANQYFDEMVAVALSSSARCV